VEYVAQTRGWFYTLFAVSGGVFDSEPFESAVCHGVILGKDGRKMSKRLKNYPDPMDLLNKHGSDALRAALLMSPVCKGEDIRFAEEAVRDVVRRFHLLTWNCLQFYKTFADIDGYRPGATAALSVDLPIDTYMLHALESLRADVDTSMETFDFFGVYTAIEKFVNVLSTWYIKLNKSRIWREGLDEDKRTCYQVLWKSLQGIALVSAPFLPFLAESMWRTLGAQGSVHLEDWPTPDPSALRPELAAEMDALQVLVTAARSVRDRNNSSLKVPLRQMRVAGVPEAVVSQNLSLLLEELNVKSLEVTDDVSQWVQERVVVNVPELAKTRAWIVKDVLAAATGGGIQVNADGTATGDGFTLAAHEFHTAVMPRPDVTSVAVNGNVVVWLDLAVDQALLLEADAREINRRLQDLRKKAGLAYTRRIRVFVSPSHRTDLIVEKHSGYLKGQLLATAIELAAPPAGAHSVAVQIQTGQVTVGFEAVPHQG
jgi:isoleucyl-tRNA synthetase